MLHLGFVREWLCLGSPARPGIRVFGPVHDPVLGSGALLPISLI